MLVRTRIQHTSPGRLTTVCHANLKANETAYYRQVANLRRAGGRLLPSDDLTGVALSNNGEFLDEYIQQQLRLCTQPKLLNQAPGAQQYKGPRLGLNSAGGGVPVSIKAAIGLTIPPPRAVSRAGGVTRMSLPELPRPNLSATRVQIDVFWDIAGKHPEDKDPRVVCKHIASLAAHYGDVTSVGAYAVRQAWNWIPDTFMKVKEQAAKAEAALQLQQQQHMAGSTKVGGDTNANRGARSSGRGTETGVRCSVCGARFSGEEKLRLHTKTVHAGVQTAQRIGGGGGTDAKRSSSHARTLGKVVRYHNSLGELFVPPPGMQLGLKYVLQQEGVDVRVLPTDQDVVSRSVIAGIDKRLAELAASPEFATQHVVVLLAESLQYQQVLRRCRQQGVATLAVCAEGVPLLEADATVGWQTLVSGTYAA